MSFLNCYKNVEEWEVIKYANVIYTNLSWISMWKKHKMKGKKSTTIN